MEAYTELSKEIGELRRQQNCQFPADLDGSQASHAGKMKTRSSGGLNRRHYSDVLGREHIILELVRKGANVTSSDDKGRTALHFASCRGDANMVKLIISYGGSVNQKDCIGNTPLHLACCTSHIGVVTTLLKAGTDVNAVDSRGVTPLHLANSRLRIARESDDISGLPLSRKPEMLHIVEMIQEYFRRTNGSQDETDELERLASKLSLSETPKQVEEVQNLLVSFTSLSIEQRKDSHTASGQGKDSHTASELRKDSHTASELRKDSHTASGQGKDSHTASESTNS